MVEQKRRGEIRKKRREGKNARQSKRIVRKRN
jgi:hypothetical protein